MDFLQSPVWREIQTIVGRDIFEIQCDDQTYRGVTRTRRVGPLHLRWHQLLGVCDIAAVACIEDAVRERFSAWNDIFFQVGISQSLLTFPLDEKKSLIPMVVAEQRDDAIAHIPDWILSRKEHMSLATVVTPLSDDETLYHSSHKEHRRMIRKARESGFEMIQATTKEQRQAFYAVWQQMGTAKDVGIMSRDSFVRVMEYVTSMGVGSLFLMMDRDVVTAGSLVCYREGAMYYVYGASNREYSTLGAHVLLQHDIMVWGYNQGYSAFDHRGVASVAYPEHHLVGVSRFKERFGGEQREYVGNVDLVTNKLLYRLMKKRG